MSDATCRSCGAPLLWALTLKGRRMPLDPDPVPGGNVSVKHIAGVLHALVVGPERGTHVSHFSTCPAAAAHRRRGDAR